MKRNLVFLAVPIFLLLVSAYGQTRQPIEVTKQTLTRQRAGKPYVIDLTHKGKTYNVTADVASRVRIRTANDEMALTDLMKKLGLTGGKSRTSKFLIGTLSDLRAINFGRPPATRTSNTATATNLTCGPFVCKCDPDIPFDCFGSKLECAGPMICDPPCEGPDCAPEQTVRWTCHCFRKF